ncbi:glycine/betaine ABC transporter substrate-binding protein [Chromobacterium violaceum]|uniref:glycine betaine ABC transporter substrate-binding protein n=1 Tax=Chromobacterium violaceum TaxID=536 RepID=UPI000C127C27|nr:glycine betaine ABC transporter substrate-binding protein [Chromobacterium violaceum]ATP28264.1 glycine/betaine ABC transporter substrate-binding protein [Chromobacterium violaceum]ATP32172.1 glycine/betaine ABC transporter substrate-binding protein [Chromobacterium violaceum]
MNTPRITLITIDLSFHAASAAVVAQLLGKHGVAVDELRAPHERAFALLAAGQGDMLCSAWLPGSHGGYLAPIENDVEKLAALYEPYALWGVPDYVPAGAVAEIADLKKPEVASRMIKRIQGINPGAGISRFSREIIARYRLDEAGYHFENGSLEDCAQAFEQAVARGDWAVAPLWQPQFLHWRHRIRALADPENLLRGRDEATLIARKDALARLPPAAVDDLRRLRLGNQAVAWLDHLICRQGATPAQAARQWLSSAGGADGRAGGDSHVQQDDIHMTTPSTQ